MNLVKHWRKLWKTYSVFFSGIIAVVSIAQAQFPLMQAVLDAKTFGMITFTLAVLAGAGRYIEQTNMTNYKKELENTIQDKVE